MSFSEDVIELTERIHDYRDQVADLTDEVSYLTCERDEWRTGCEKARGRAERAEHEAAEWKRQFQHTYKLYSALLDRTIEDLNTIEERTA